MANTTLADKAKLDGRSFDNFGNLYGEHHSARKGKRDGRGFGDLAAAGVLTSRAFAKICTRSLNRAFFSRVSANKVFAKIIC